MISVWIPSFITMFVVTSVIQMFGLKPGAHSIRHDADNVVSDDEKTATPPIQRVTKRQTHNQTGTTTNTTTLPALAQKPLKVNNKETEEDKKTKTKSQQNPSLMQWKWRENSWQIETYERWKRKHIRTNINWMFRFRFWATLATWADDGLCA